MIDSSVPNWTAVWALPNVTIDEPIETSLAALVPCTDDRLVSLGNEHPALKTFVSAFRDEFGTPICPTIGMVRVGAPQVIKMTATFGGFRDAVCFAAIVAGQCVALKSDTLLGVVHSDAFDVYPWFFPQGQFDERIVAFTPAIAGMHEAKRLRPQSAPALGKRSLSNALIDQPLLTSLLTRWERSFGGACQTVEDRRLFRALEMARAASRTPGG
jgi:hypothetical protein